MKNNTNIYDIDGEIIRKVGDNHEFTIQEVQEKIKYYNDKLKDEKDEKKAAVYRTYIVNLTNYAAYLMSRMSKTELSDLISAAAPKKTSSEEVEKALTNIEVAENQEDAEEIEAEDLGGIYTGNGILAQIEEENKKLEAARKKYEQKESEYVDFEEV